VTETETLFLAPVAGLGDLYRFDGWEKYADGCRSSGGGTWTKARQKGDVVAGQKRLWVWRYE
jgi:hypothetical protein